MESKGETIKAPISLRDLRRRIYRKAKAEPAWRFWGLYVHVCKLETLREAYRLVKQNNGAPGIDGVTFETIEAGGLEAWLQQLRVELLGHSYCPTRLRRVEIPKRGGGCARNWPNSTSISTRRRVDTLTWQREKASGSWVTIGGWISARCVLISHHSGAAPASSRRPRKLVRRGLYRYSRNPMFVVGVLTVIFRWAGPLSKPSRCGIRSWGRTLFLFLRCILQRACCQDVLKQMRSQESGHIVNIAPAGDHAFCEAGAVRRRERRPHAIQQGTGF